MLEFQNKDGRQGFSFISLWTRQSFYLWRLVWNSSWCYNELLFVQQMFLCVFCVFLPFLLPLTTNKHPYQLWNFFHPRQVSIFMVTKFHLNLQHQSFSSRFYNLSINASLLECEVGKNSLALVRNTVVKCLCDQRKTAVVTAQTRFCAVIHISPKLIWKATFVRISFFTLTGWTDEELQYVRERVLLRCHRQHQRC